MIQQISMILKLVGILNDIIIHLTVIVSLRVPLLLAYDLSNLDVILLLFNSVPAFQVPISASLPNYSITLFIQFWEVLQNKETLRKS